MYVPALLVRVLDPGFDSHHGERPRLSGSVTILARNTGVDALKLEMHKMEIFTI